MAVYEFNPRLLAALEVGIRGFDISKVCKTLARNVDKIRFYLWPAECV